MSRRGWRRELDVIEHRFNHDVCLRTEDKAVVERRWPALTQPLVNATLASSFAGYESAAKKYKRLVHASGTVSIAFALVSVAGAAAEVANVRWAADHGALFGACASISLVTAFLSSRYWRWRRQWMIARFATEVLRQQHFLHLLQATKWKADSEWAQTILDDLRRAAAARMTSFIEGDFHVQPPGKLELPADPVLRQQVLDAYLSLRLQHQLDYATYKTSPTDKSYFGLSAELVLVVTDRLAGLSLIGAIVLALLTALHLSGGRRLAAATIAFMLLGVGLKAWRDGVGIDADYDRYHHYRRTLTLLKARWIGVQDEKDYLGVASEVERAAGDELHAFLGTHSTAQFLL